MKVELQHLTKRWGDIAGAEDISLTIEDGEFVALLGPSGCGKTTTLLMIAGIYKPTEGQILFDGKVVNTVPPKDRNIGMVFQSYALYPHMNVFQNIGYPLKLQKVPKDEARQRVRRVADMMGIGDLLDRKPAQLSGGQQQRVALGRALVKEPQLLLFDEPLSNLDARLRLSMRSEIKRLQMELGITSIYVTHDQVEAMTMADRVAVIKDGHLQAYGPPEELYDRPKTLFIAGFIGNPPMNFMDVEIKQEGDTFFAIGKGIRIPIPAERAQKAASAGGPVVLGIRPDNIHIDEEGIPGEVLIVEPLGRDDLLDVQVGEQHMQVLADPEKRLRMGDTVHLRFDTRAVQFFDPASERSLLW